MGKKKVYWYIRGKHGKEDIVIHFILCKAVSHMKPTRTRVGGGLWGFRFMPGMGLFYRCLSAHLGPVQLH